MKKIEVVALGDSKKKKPQDDQSYVCPQNSTNFQESLESEDFVADVLMNFTTNTKISLAKRDDMIVSAIDFLTRKTGSITLQKLYFVSLSFLAKTHDEVFKSNAIITKLVGVLYVTTSTTTNLKKTVSMCLLAIHILEKVMATTHEWSEIIIKAFIMDSLLDRIWVDHEYLKDFGDVIILALQGKSELVPQDIIYGCIQHLINEMRNNSKLQVKYVLNMCRSLACVPQIRLFSMQSLESWLNHPTITKNVWEVANSVVGEMYRVEEVDVETIQTLLEVKMKPIHAGAYAECLSILAQTNAYYTQLIMRNLVQNEIGRNQMNSKVLQMVFKSLGEARDGVLALILQEIAFMPAFEKDMKNFVRKIVKNLIAEINIVGVIAALFQKREEMLGQDPQATENWILFIADIATSLMCQYFISQPKCDDSTLLRLGLSNYLSYVLNWIHTIVPLYVDIERVDFCSLISTVMFLNQPGSYLPNSLESLSDLERNLFVYWMLAIPLDDSFFLQILSLGMMMNNKEFLLDVTQKMISRAAVLKRNFNINAISLTRADLPFAFVQLAIYMNPYKLSKMYQIYLQPLFWKAVFIGVALICFNSSTLGAVGWHIPMFKSLMQMIISNRYDTVINRAESNEIHSFLEEMMNCDQTFLSQKDDPQLAGHFVCWDQDSDLPNLNRDTLFVLKRLDEDCGLSEMLQSCRSPDFLLDMIHSEGSQNAISWLTGILQNGAFLTLLPLQTTCDILIILLGNRSEQVGLVSKLTDRLKAALNSDVDLTLLNILFHNLVSKSATTRKFTRFTFERILPEHPKHWIYSLDSLKSFEQCKELIVHVFSQCILIDTNIDYILAFTEYVYSHALCSSYQIGIYLCELLKTTKFQVLEDERMHTLTQKILLEAFIFVQSNQFFNQNTLPLVDLIYYEGDEEIHLPIPKILIQGIIKFVTLPCQREFIQSFQDFVKKILNRDVEIVDGNKSPILKEADYGRLIYCTDPYLFSMGMSNLKLEDQLLILGKFGISQACIDIVAKEIMGKKDLVKKSLKNLIKKPEGGALLKFIHLKGNLEIQLFLRECLGEKEEKETVFVTKATPKVILTQQTIADVCLSTEVGLKAVSSLLLDSERSKLSSKLLLLITEVNLMTLLPILNIVCSNDELADWLSKKKLKPSNLQSYIVSTYELHPKLMEDIIRSSIIKNHPRNVSISQLLEVFPSVSTFTTILSPFWSEIIHHEISNSGMTILFNTLLNSKALEPSKRKKQDLVDNDAGFIARYGLFFDLIAKVDPELSNEVFREIMFGFNGSKSETIENFIHSSNRNEINEYLLNRILTSDSSRLREILEMIPSQNICTVQTCLEFIEALTIKDKSYAKIFEQMSFTAQFLVNTFMTVDIKHMERPFFDLVLQEVEAGDNLKLLVERMVNVKKWDVLNFLISKFPEKYELFPVECVPSHVTKFDKMIHRWCVLLFKHDQDSESGYYIFKSYATKYPRIVGRYAKTLSAMLDNVTYSDESEIHALKVIYSRVMDILLILHQYGIDVGHSRERVEQFASKQRKKDTFSLISAKLYSSQLDEYIPQHDSRICDTTLLSNLKPQVNRNASLSTLFKDQSSKFIADNIPLILSSASDAFDLNNTRFALELLLKLLQDSPSYYNTIIPGFITLLSSHSETISRTALKYAPQFYPFALQHSSLLIQSTFSLGQDAYPALEQIYRFKLGYQ